MLQKVQAIRKRNFKSFLTKTVKKHGKAVVVFVEPDGYRRRLITDQGDCKVAYKTDGHKKWSGYGESCFMEYAETQTNYHGCYDWDYGWHTPKRKKDKKKTLTNTINALIEHDAYEDIYPSEIHFGKGMKKKVYIIN